MGIFESFLFSNLRQSLSNLVMYKSRGKQIVRGKPSNIHNPQTLAQQQQRLRFKQCIRLSASFTNLVSIGFPHAYKTGSVNAFVSANIKLFEVDDQLQVKVDFRRLACSAGQQQPPCLQAQWCEELKAFRIKPGIQPISAYALREDQIYVVLFESQKRSYILKKAGERGKLTEQLYSLPSKWQKENVYIYAFAVSDTGKRASATVLLYPGPADSGKDVRT